jgi:hypothetical protein
MLQMKNLSSQAVILSLQKQEQLKLPRLQTRVRLRQTMMQARSPVKQ